jgi:hypothetical protein
MTVSFKSVFTHLASSSSFRRLLSFLLPISFFVIVLTCVRFANVFEYNIDEGIYTMRAYLYMKGYALYKDIWMDQPPLLVLVLSSLFKILGPSMYLARLLIVLFSTLLLWSVYQIISKTQNTLSALWAVVAIVLSSSYLQFSVAVVSTVPTIALAMLSIYGIVLYQESYKKRYLLFSGGVFGLALMIRFFAIIFLPGIIAEVFIFERKKRTSGENVFARPISASVWWFVVFSAVVLYIAFVAAPISFYQIIQPSMLARKLFFMGAQKISQWFIEAYDILPLALGALFFVKLYHRRLFLVPLLNFIFGVLILATHNPRWPHHQLYVIVPLCWLASFGVYALCRQVGEEWKNRNKPLSRRAALAIFFLSSPFLLSLVTIPSKYNRLTNQLLQQQWSGDWGIVNLMKQYSKQTHLVVTDSPIFAFYAQLPVHPYLASCEVKRVKTELLTADDFIAIIKKEKPELILFAGFPAISLRVIPHIKDFYDLVYHSPNRSARLYVLKRILDKVPER